VDYTTTARVKLEARINESKDDSLIDALVTAASRAIDRYCTGEQSSASDGYFGQSTLTDELVTGWITNRGDLQFTLHKPNITNVAALAYKINFMDSAFTSIPANQIQVDGSPFVTAYGISAGAQFTNVGGNFGLWRSPDSRSVFGKVTYTGGYATDPNSLPRDLIEAATVLTIRYYREAETGMSDAIGVAELGVLSYTLAIPTRVQAMLLPYMRSVPWRYAT
jgi:hypothetical protein